MIKICMNTGKSMSVLNESGSLEHSCFHCHGWQVNREGAGWWNWTSYGSYLSSSLPLSPSANSYSFQSLVDMALQWVSCFLMVSALVVK